MLPCLLSVRRKKMEEKRNPNDPLSWGRGFEDDNLELKRSKNVMTGLRLKHKVGESLNTFVLSCSSSAIDLGVIYDDEPNEKEQNWFLDAIPFVAPRKLYKK